MENTETHCYCGNVDLTHPEGTFQCSECKKRFHPDCLKKPVMSALEADTFYQFKCSRCDPEGTERYSRARISWQDALILSLYNLQLSGGGKRGFFRWKEHICDFINKHWLLLFGPDRKKKAAWYGTVAGAMSAGCPQHFVSGTKELGETGWWKLASMKPPLYSVDPPSKNLRRKRRTVEMRMAMEVPEKDQEEDGSNSKRSRRSKVFSLSAAIELKAKRSTITDHPGRKRKTMRDLQKALSEAAAAAALAVTPPHEDDHSSLHSCPEVSGHEGDMNNISVGLITVSSGPLGISQALVSGPRHLLVSAETGDPSVASTSRQVQMVTPKSELICSEESWISGESTSMLGFQGTSSGGSHAERVKIEMSPLAAIAMSEAMEDESVQVPSAHSLLLNSEDIDNEDVDMYGDPYLDSSTMSLTHDPRRSPDMVDLLMSMPGSRDEEDEAQHPLLSTHVFQSPQCLNDTPHSTTYLGKHPPKTQKPASDEDSEGPEEEALGERSEEEEDDEEEEEEEEEEMGKGEVKEATVTVLSIATAARSVRRARQNRRKLKEQKEKEAEEDPAGNLRFMTPYDERVMLRKLESVMTAQPRALDGQTLDSWDVKRLCHHRNLLYRKLKVRQLQREHGVPVFDIDAILARLAEKYHGIKPQSKQVETQSGSSHHPHSVRTLDRFMRRTGRGNTEVCHTSFHTRLVGFEDHQLQPITSPYTLRILKPFIWRDTETVPLKVKLMQEIIRYPHRSDPTWTAPAPASVDYCYVRPQHIPSINALCNAFFWPGIDLSECLQYPDFSCVAMYRKLVVGFAFLVPDVKHNEAYISFIFTRPNWREAGIASFMLYHLCQTCMGKDITLHVSATNPAMLLYQKFGFKAEELCLDFYDKYFPVDSRECKHAFFMRLR